MANISAIPTFPTNSTTTSENPAVAEAIRACMSLLATLPTDAQRQKALQQFLLVRPIQERTMLEQLDPDNGLKDAKTMFETSSAQQRQEHEARMTALKEAKKRDDEAKAKAAAAIAAAGSPSKEKKKEKKHEKKGKKHEKQEKQRAATPDSSSDSSSSSDESSSE